MWYIECGFPFISNFNESIYKKAPINNQRRQLIHLVEFISRQSYFLHSKDDAPTHFHVTCIFREGTN